MLARALTLQSRGNHLRNIVPSLQASQSFFSSTTWSTGRTQWSTRRTQSDTVTTPTGKQRIPGAYTSRRNQSPQRVASNADSTRSSASAPTSYKSRRVQIPELNDADLTHLVLNILELSQSQESNDFVMDQVRSSQPRIRELIVEQILEESVVHEMITNKLSCRVIASLFSRGDSSKRARIVAALEDYVSFIAADQYGCSFIQTALEELDEEERAPLVSELLDSSDNAVAAAMHPFGRFVMLQLVDVATPNEVAVMSELLQGSAMELSSDRYGCVFLKKCLSVFPEDKRALLVDELLGSEKDAVNAIMDRYGHFIYQYFLEHGTGLEINRITQLLNGGMVEFSMNDNANFVVRSVIAISKSDNINDTNDDDYSVDNNNNMRRLILDELVASPESLFDLSCSEYGKLVVQELFSSGVEAFVAPIAAMVKDRVFELSTDEHGSFVVGYALKWPAPEEREALCAEIISSRKQIMEVATHQYGVFVISKILEGSISQSTLDTIGNAFKDQAVKLAVSQHGRFSLKYALAVLGGDERQVLVDELLSSPETILDSVKDIHAYIVIEFLTEDGTDDERRKIAHALKGHALDLVLHTRAHRVVKKALETMPPIEREMLADELRTSSEDDHRRLGTTLHGREILRLL